MISIWTRYLTKEMIKIFLFFILSLYFLYSLIDYSSRIDYYNALPWTSILVYYVCILSQKTELLLPFAFMVSVIKVLTTMNTHHELVSMLMSGRSYKRLLTPLFIFAAILSMILYLNFEFLEPHAQEKIELIKQRKKGGKESKVKSFILDNGSKLVFNNYDTANRTLEKVYWLQSPDHVYYMKKLYPYSSPPIAHHVLEFERSDNSDLKLVSVQDLKPLYEMELRFDPVLKSFSSIRTYSISALIKLICEPSLNINMDKAELLTLLNYKLAVPLLPIFTLLALAPICTRFSRQTPIFIIYMISIAAMLSFFTSMDACYILSENRLIPPQFALWIPFLLFFIYPTKKFIRF